MEGLTCSTWLPSTWRRGESYSTRCEIAILAATAASGDPTIAPSFAALTNRLLAAI